MTDEQYNLLLERIRKWVAELAAEGKDEKPLYRTGETEVVTPRSVLVALEARSEFGLSIAKTMFSLANLQE